MTTVVRIGTSKGKREGVRLGTVRLLPRGVKKEEYAARNFFDLWLPEVSPGRPLVAYAQAKPWTDARWATYTRRYHAEMQRPAARHLIEALAALSKQANFSLCCYCENPFRCHRSLLAELIREAGGTVAGASTFR